MKNFILLVLLMTSTIVNAQGFTSLLITTITPEKILSTASVMPIADVNVLFSSNKDLVKFTNPSPMNEIRVYNAKGKLVSTIAHASDSYVLNMSQFKSGKYCFRVQIQNEIVTKIIVKE